MIETILLDIMRQYGKVDDDIEESVLEAVKNENYRFIVRDGVPVGFWTWLVEDDRVYINNLLIWERHKDNLLNLRTFFRRRYPNKTFYWKNYKRDRIITRK